MTPKKKPAMDWPMLVAFILVCELAGAMGALLMAGSPGAWYSALAKPGFTPPAWVFAPVWTLLYALMGIALYLVWQKRKERRIQVMHAVLFFALQLIVNVKWSLLFFGMHSPLFGLLDILVLLALILITAFKFYRIDKRAGYLFIPYVVWVVFAALLNAAIWMLN